MLYIKKFIAEDGFGSAREILIYTYWIYKSSRGKEYGFIEANHRLFTRVI